MAIDGKLYGLKNCDSCRKALKALPGLELVDVRDEGMPPELLERAHVHFGQALINTRSTTWRSLSEDERSAEPLALLARHPTLMKRPLMLVDNQLFLGWSKAIEEEIKALG